MNIICMDVNGLHLVLQDLTFVIGHNRVLEAKTAVYRSYNIYIYIQTMPMTAVVDSDTLLSLIVNVQVL